MPDPRITWRPWEGAPRLVKPDCLFCLNDAVEAACCGEGGQSATIRACAEPKCRELAERFALSCVFGEPFERAS